jgi:hypothetical protein
MRCPSTVAALEARGEGRCWPPLCLVLRACLLTCPVLGTMRAAAFGVRLPSGRDGPERISSRPATNLLGLSYPMSCAPNGAAAWPVMCGGSQVITSTVDSVGQQRGVPASDCSVLFLSSRTPHLDVRGIVVALRRRSAAACRSACAPCAGGRTTVLHQNL